MWNKKIRQLKRQMQTLHLDVDQKKQGKNNLQAFMKEHPVRIEDDARHIYQNTRGNIFSFFTQKPMFGTLALILTLLTGTGTAFAAEASLPGDPLYPVKVHVNEQVRSALAIGAEAQTDWDARRAERRLEEASKLAAEGKLEGEVETNLQARFENQTQKIKEQISKLEANGNISAASALGARLEAALQVHEQLLLDIKGENEDEPKENRPLLKEIREETKRIEEIRTELEAEVKTRTTPNTKSAAEGRMKSSLKQIQEVQAYLNKKDVSATSSAQLKLNAALELHGNGVQQFDAQNYAVAFTTFARAERLAQEARLLVRIRHQLDQVKTQIDTVIERVEKREEENRERERKAEIESETKVESEIEIETEDDSGGINAENTVSGSLETRIGL